MKFLQKDNEEMALAIKMLETQNYELEVKKLRNMFLVSKQKKNAELEKKQKKNEQKQKKVLQEKEKESAKLRSEINELTSQAPGRLMSTRRKEEFIPIQEFE